MRRAFLLTALGLLATAPAATAAGGPVSPVQGGVGVSAPGGAERYVAVAAGAGRTVVMRISKADASVRRSRVLDGSFGIPAVTYDGVNTGLSADRGTLVVAQGFNRFPVRRTKLRVLDAGTLRTRRSIDLPGMVTVDAVSPTGRWMYLVDYRDGNATQYDVRAYDLERGRLLSKPVVDPREPEEKLQGIPLTRVESQDGRWAYTLYSGEESFIHALDTEGRTAVCIDLPRLRVEDLADVKLALGSGALVVKRAGTPIANVDLKDFKVSEPGARPVKTPAPTPAAKSSSDAGPPVILWAIPFVVFAGLALAARQRLARHSATS
jgi:hypothetical protein